LHKRDEKNRYQGVRQAGLLSTVPILLVVAPLVGFFIGRFIDSRAGTDPIFTVVFLVLGFIAGARQIARVIKLANKESDKKE